MSAKSVKTTIALSKEAIYRALWERGDIQHILSPVQKELFDVYMNAEDNATLVWLLARQTGKCIKAGTLVSTPLGPVKIEDIRIGDTIFGYNQDGTISPTEVKQVHKQGIKKVFDLNHRNRTVCSSTLEHRWLAYNTCTKKTEIINTEELLTSKHKKIKREYFDLVGGEVHEPHAYSLGALLGDGYCSAKGAYSSTFISSQTEEIPNAVANELNCFTWKHSSNNYTWTLSTEYKIGKGKKSEKLKINHYDEWCLNRLAHEKICDFNIIKTWTRESQLRFLAGLLDTDGSVFITGRTQNELKFSLSMQSKSVIDTVKNMVLGLFQIELCEQLDDREKYVNGPCYTVYSNNNFCVKRILKALTPYLKLERKKYKDDYDDFPEYNHVPEYCGVTDGESYETETYDIGIDNGTHLYCLANGLVTHNSYCLALIALMTAIKNPKCIVNILTDTKLHMEEIILPKFEEVMDNIICPCPEDLRPRYEKAKYKYHFTNGSQINLAGADGGHFEKMRGKKAKLNIVDEAGFCDKLGEIVMDVLLPTTTHTGGKIILSSTPPKDFDHDFNSYVEAAEIEGYLTKKTLFDNTLLTQDQIEKIIKRYPGGINNRSFQREYMCVDENTLIKTITGYKEIKTIEVGEQVFTHEGRYRPVVHKFVNPRNKRQMYRIQTSNGLGDIMTEDHKLLVSTVSKKVGISSLKTEWTEARNIELKETQKKYIKVPIEKLEGAEIDYDLCYLAGWFIAEGHFSKEVQQSTLSLNNFDDINGINESSLRVFGKKFINYASNPEGTCHQWSLNSKRAKEFFSQFGEGAKNKFIPSKFKNINKHNQIQLLKGLFLGDGWFVEDRKYCGVGSISKQLIFDISEILLSLGIKNSIIQNAKEGPSVILGRDVNINNSYTVNVYGEGFDELYNYFFNETLERKSTRTSGFIKDGYYYARIRKIEKIDYDKDFVYDIEVEEDHSYVGVHCTFHNCVMLKDPERSVFPEVDDDMLKVVVREYPKPVYYTPYVGMDIGFKDLTVVLFGYHDFKSNKIIIEREIVKSGPQLKLKEFTEEILSTEELLWTNLMTGEILDPKMRTSDIEPIVTQEIYNHSGARLYFTPVRKEKGYKLPLINHIRMMLCDGQILINPRCKILINHLKNAKWSNNQKDDFARSPGNDKENIPASHYDAADALLYMIKGMDLNFNPIPRHARGSQPDFIRNPSTYNHGNSQSPADVFRAIFGKKNRK